MRNLLATLIAAASFLPPAHAQTPLTYDAVSIKPNKSETRSMSWRGGDAASFSGTNLDVLLLLTSAYDTRRDLITGLPAWAKDDHFDVNAKIVDPDAATIKSITPEQRRAMLAQMLADRFHLKIHPEIKQLPVYDLVLAKGGSKLTPNGAVYVKDGPPPAKGRMGPGSFMSNTGDFLGEAIPLASFINSLSSELERNIIDKTGLTGTYDLHLKWTPDRTALAGPDSGKSEDAAPPLFTAIEQQLGLKLIPAKGPVQTWVVDHIDHPTEN